MVQVLAEVRGLPHCKNFIIDLIMPYLHDKDIMEIWKCDDPRITVNKILSNEGLPAYEARILRETGRNTVLGCFVVGLYSNKNLLGYGKYISPMLFFKIILLSSSRGDCRYRPYNGRI